MILNHLLVINISLHSIRYERPICTCILDISPDIRYRYEIPHPIRSRYLIFRTLFPTSETSSLILQSS